MLISAQVILKTELQMLAVKERVWVLKLTQICQLPAHIPQVLVFTRWQQLMDLFQVQII